MNKELKEKIVRLFMIFFFASLLALCIKGTIALVEFSVEKVHGKEIEEIRNESEGGLLAGIIPDPVIYVLFVLYGVGVFAFSKAMLQDAVVYRKLKKCKVPFDKDKYLREPPDKGECPLTMFWIMKNEYDYYMDSTCFPDIFTSLLMSLKKKGAIEFIFNKSDDKKTGLNIKLNDIKDIELSLGEEQTYKFLNAIYAEYKALTPEIVRLCMTQNVTTTNKLKENYRKAAWVDLVKRKYYAGTPKELSFINRKNSYYYLMVFEVFITAILVGGITNFALQLGLFAIMWNGFLIEFIVHDVICYTAVRLSENGQKKRNEWLAFEKYLKEYSMLDERNIDEIELWEDYLMYATAMGIADEITKKMNLDITGTNAQIGNYIVSYTGSKKENEEYLQKYINIYKEALASVSDKSSKIQNFKKSVEAKKEYGKQSYI